MKRKRGASLEPLLGIFRNSEYRVILYAKGEPFCAPPPTDELPVEDILAEFDVRILPLSNMVRARARTL